MEKNFRILKKKLLAVEGNDEFNFFASLSRYENIEGVQPVDIGGKDKFEFSLGALKEFPLFRNVEALGFVRDAETLPAHSAFISICAILQKNNLPVPVSINKITGDKPRTGIFIMPDNQNSGALENLCLQTLEGIKIKECIDDYISCFYPDMNQHEKEKFNEPKSKILLFLSSRAPIVNALGLGAQKGYWDFMHQCFDDIKKFLHSLFD